MPAPKADSAKHVYEATVTKIKDGDTISASIRLRRTRTADKDLGFHIYQEKGYLVLHEDIRFFGINTPEHGTEAGDASTAYLKGLIKPGDTVTVATKVVKDRTTKAENDAKEKFGRWLGTVWREQDATSLNDQMVASGHAKPWDGQGAKPV